ncbi:MAG: anaerobic ribonucleoside-triphosphate reductase activating protein [Clostridia bacterium]|nr:anaerobic ribonucleoside-triphosphate reductase activating protein [Clostridia bacterium]
MIINGFEKLSLVDYPGFTAATVFTSACNMRCPFCHNAILVIDAKHQPIVEEQYVLDYLNKRKGIIDGLCITGGEPTLQKDLDAFIKKCKETGVKIKLDSNGTNPETLKSLISQNLLDYVAMDIKNCKEKYSITANASIDLTKIQESIDILESSNVDHEFRTTLVKEFHTIEDIEKIAQWLDGTNKYYLQKFEDKGGCIQDGLHEVPLDQAHKMRDIAKEFIKHVELRSYE